MRILTLPPVFRGRFDFCNNISFTESNFIVFSCIITKARVSRIWLELRFDALVEGECCNAHISRRRWCSRRRWWWCNKGRRSRLNYCDKRTWVLQSGSLNVREVAAAGVGVEEEAVAQLPPLQPQQGLQVVEQPRRSLLSIESLRVERRNTIQRGLHGNKPVFPPGPTPDHHPSSISSICSIYSPSTRFISLSSVACRS